MPVYVRKSQQIPQPSWNEFVEDETDYVTDPDQFRDQLPQPFRMVDKVLTLILDAAWDTISDRESLRIAEFSKVRPPQYECALQVQVKGNPVSLAESSDGLFVFAGCDDGLVMVDALTQNVVCHWEQENVEISSLHVSQLAEQVYLVSTVDDMGVARIFICGGEKIYLVKVMNEQDGSSSKLLCNKCESSAESGYVGIAFENTGSSEQWLEFYKCPKDIWMKELEAVNPQAIKKSATTPQPEETQQVAPPVIPEEAEKLSTENTSQRSSARSDRRGSGKKSRKKSRKSPSASGRSRSRSRSVSPAEKTGEDSVASQEEDGKSTVGATGTDEKDSYKFSAPTLILKVKAPTPVTGSSVSSAYHAMKSCDSGDVIGSGNNHFITSHHLQQRHEMFEKLHEQFLKYMPPEEKPAPLQASFIFLHPGRHMPAGMEQPSLTGQPTSVAVWWSGGTQIMHYSLIKQAKDLEHKPDLVWPSSTIISTVSATPCSTLVAVALTNGNITIWDRHMGISRGTKHVTDDSSIEQLIFLDPSIFPQQEVSYPPYPTSTNSCLLVSCADGSTILLDTYLNKNTPAQIISPKCEKEDERCSLIQPFAGLPELVISVNHGGCVFLQDVRRGMTLCQVVTPHGFEVSSPWQPSVVTTGNGQMLYVKANCLPDQTSAGKKTALFAFQTRSFPTLDRYRRQTHEEVPYAVHNTIEKRIESLFAYRLSQQEPRKSRMQGRWYQLKDELFLIQQIRDTKHKRAQIRSTFAEPVH